MTLLITGADLPFGRAVAEHFASAGRRVRATGLLAPSEVDLPGAGYLRADLCLPEEVAPLVEGVDAVLHLAEFDAERPEADAENLALKRATLGAYTLCEAAREAGVGRVVVAARLSVFDTYPDDYLIDEQWKPRPAAHAALLAPYLCEMVVREFMRAGPMTGVGLRFRPIGDDLELNTRLEDALAAIERALELELGPPGYRWHAFHVASSPRFLMRQADLTLGLHGAED